MELDINTIILAVIGVLLPLGLGFIAGKWAAIVAAAKESPNKFDDKAVEAIQKLAQMIVDAKMEDPPTTKTGGGGTQPPGGGNGGKGGGG